MNTLRFWTQPRTLALYCKKTKAQLVILNLEEPIQLIWICPIFILQIQGINSINMMSFFSFTDRHVIFVWPNRILFRVQIPRIFLNIIKRSHWIKTCGTIWFLFLDGSRWPFFWNCLVLFIHTLWSLLLLYSHSNDFIAITSEYVQIGNNT